MTNHATGTREEWLLAVPAQMLLAQLAEADPRLAHKAAAGEMDPRTHRRMSFPGFIRWVEIASSLRSSQWRLSGT